MLTAAEPPHRCGEPAASVRRVLMTAFASRRSTRRAGCGAGLLDADSARAVRDRLRADGLTPTAVDPAPVAAIARCIVRAARARSVALLTRQLATLVQSGMPLDQALVAVAEQADDARAAKLVAALADARRRPANRCPRRSHAFRARSRRSIADWSRAGTETGRLPEVLARLADYLEARLALRQKFVVALIYPALVTVIAFGVIAVLVTYVVPQVVSVYQQSRQTLPWLTQALIATQRFLSRDRMVVARGDRRSAVDRVRARADGGRASRARWHACAAAACRASGASLRASTPRASRARSPSSSAAARRSCARSTPPATSCG